MLTDVKKSIYEQVVYQSGTEKGFAEDLEHNDAVKLYAKLPSWFKVATPLGTYNPDWAVLIEKDGAERLYLVVETKSGRLRMMSEKKSMQKSNAEGRISKHSRSGRTRLTTGLLDPSMTSLPQIDRAEDSHTRRRRNGVA